MAELSLKERLQPSLLDRLTDDDPRERAEPRDRRVMSPTQLRESVRRDLTSLFNSTHLAASFARIEEYPLAARSVVNFGIPDLAGRTASTVDLAELERLLRQAIWDFEPRLVRNTVTVRALVDEGGPAHNVLSFAIEADLWAQPLPLRMLLETRIDLEDGRIQIGEAGAPARP
jgi:type VI secretion system protein ImpF